MRSHILQKGREGGEEEGQKKKGGRKGKKEGRKRLTENTMLLQYLGLVKIWSY